MHRRTTSTSLLVGLLAPLCLGSAVGGSLGCGKDAPASLDATAPVDAAVNHDLSVELPDLSQRSDGGIVVAPDLGTGPMLAECGDLGQCIKIVVGPPGQMFPLQSDPQPPTNELDNGVNRDGNGYLDLSSTHSSVDFLWIANTNDWNIGSVSKMNSKGVKEVARYFTVTCFSNVGSSRSTCDGTNGCCARDDVDNWSARKSGMAGAPHQPVQRAVNLPSRTAVDFNGDVWVGNRAFGGQSSVTKIANDYSECTERNGQPGVQTSHDINGDGVIDTDCNGNGIPDDIGDVRSLPCSNGMAQEFYGFDDECVLFTVNTNTPDQWGRPLALKADLATTAPADAWAGTWKDGTWYRLDGQTGYIKAQAKMPGNPYGAIIDAQGILWSPKNEGGMSWLDTNDTSKSGSVRTPTGYDARCYGISLDRDQNVWCGGWMTGQANRYTPDRSSGNANLSMGRWTLVLDPGKNAGAIGSGRGIATDLRSASTYFTWLARDGGYVVRIPASSLPTPQPGMDSIVDGKGYPAMQVAGKDTVGVGVDTSQNIWGISQVGSVATRIQVDAQGNMSQPDLTSGNVGMGCPVGAGDRCGLQFKDHGAAASPMHEPNPYTYSDFTGFGLRNFAAPRGSYDWVQPGCATGVPTWYSLTWNADVPPSTTLSVRVRSGPSPVPNSSWTSWTSDFTSSPVDLHDRLPRQDSNLEVEFNFTSSDKNATVTLKNFTIYYVCGMMIM